MNNNERIKTIMRTSVIGIATNALLALTKVLIGTAANSIAVVLDGINNLSDAGSSMITLIGASLASRPADPEHPFGHGRMEYISSLIIGALVTYAGITAFTESLGKIIHPEVSDYSTVALIVIAVALVVKLVLGLFFLKQGEKTDSDSLTASGKDAMNDVLLSGSTLAAALIYVLFKVSLEAYLGLVLSFMIIKAGAEVLKDTVSKLLGEPADVQTVIDIKKYIAGFEGVNGVFDLILNDYGPEHSTATVHIEVSEKMSIPELDRLSRSIMESVEEKFNVHLLSVGIYAKNQQNDETVEMENKIRELVLQREHIRGMHGFFADHSAKHIRFDLVVSLNSKDRKAVFEDTLTAVREAYPGYDVKAGMDIDFTEISSAH